MPGYGMALSQAQTLVKQTADLLESMGKSVDFAIHPVAGRMPGHMNVLLAEADVPYDKLREMDDINPEFAQTDVVLVIGANDVVNPAAKSAEGTPRSMACPSLMLRKPDTSSSSTLMTSPAMPVSIIRFIPQILKSSSYSWRREIHP